MVHSNKPKNSEVDAYSYIKEELETLGWIVKNPARVTEGEVYKQNEGLYNEEIKKCLDRDMPEAIIKLNECDFWIIESKRDKKDINKALDEAKNQYAKKINTSKNIFCPIISGVAGNYTDGFTVVNQYLHKGNWETILFNGQTKDTLLSKQQAKYILENKTINYQDFPDFPEEKYLKSAEKINEILHNAGINKNKRARFIAGLVLSLSLGRDIDLRIDKTTLLVDNVNNLIKAKLSEVDKENFYDFIKLEVPPSKENHIKYRQAIIQTLRELQTLDIKNAMASGNDVLGKFYEKFLKYGNGAKEIGIVLTPRHITNFGVEILNVTHNDFVLDPACGTAGFLVSAFDYVKKYANEDQIDKFKNHNLFGIEQDDEVVALALVNMIFRGDGRNNMSEGNCFQKSILKTQVEEELTGKYDKSLNVIEKKKDKKGNVKESVKEIKKNPDPIITRVLMNPPFALKKSDEKERHFIEFALSQMQDGGLLFAVIPISVMIEKEGKNWRKNELLKNNTLLSVVTLPEDLFYPVGTHTVGLFIKKGISHDYENQKVYFARGMTDGFRKKKGKRVLDENGENILEEIKEELKAFIINQNLKFKDIPEIKKICLLDKDDSDVELAPETYIDDKNPDFNEVIESIENLVRETAGYLLTLGKKEIIIKNKSKNVDLKNKIKYFDLEGKKGICNVERKYAPYLNELISDNKIIPYVTTTESNNGISLRCDSEPNFKRDSVSVSLDGICGTTFYQFEDFISGEKTAVLTLKKEHNPYLLFYIAALIRIMAWRFHYGRKLSMARLKKFKIPLPITDKNEIDYNAIEKIVKNSYGWEIIESNL